MFSIASGPPNQGRLKLVLSLQYGPRISVARLGRVAFLCKIMEHRCDAGFWSVLVCRCPQLFHEITISAASKKMPGREPSIADARKVVSALSKPCEPPPSANHFDALAPHFPAGHVWPGRLRRRPQPCCRAGLMRICATG